MPSELATFTLPAELTAEPDTVVLQSPKVAVTTEFPVKGTVQVVPVHPGQDQPTLVLLVDGVAVSVIEVPDAKLEIQLAPVPQLMPFGELVTVPVPAPALATCSE